MAGYISGDTRKVTTHRLVEMKQRGEKISMLTSYDYTTAQIVDGAGIDVILVCLLYTSPSPRDRTRSRMPSSA